MPETKCMGKSEFDRKKQIDPFSTVVYDPYRYG